MPHYKDGTRARVGDQVRGKSYNRGGHEEVGVVVAITSLTTEVCNARFYFPFKALSTTAEHPVAGTDYVSEGLDYGELKAFEKVTEDASVAPPV